MVICLEQCADLHMAQLMPLPLTVSCFTKIQIGFAFLVPAHPDSPKNGPLNGCVCKYYLVFVNVCCVICLSCFFSCVVCVLNCYILCKVNYIGNKNCHALRCVALLCVWRYINVDDDDDAIC